MDLLNCNVSADYTRLENPSLLKSTPVGVVIVRQYLPLGWVRIATKVSEEEGSYASRYYHWFLKHLKELSLTSCTFNGLIETNLHRCQLEGSCYDCLWHGDKGAWYRKFPQRIIADLNSGITFHSTKNEVLRWSLLLKKFLMENLIYCAVSVALFSK